MKPSSGPHTGPSFIIAVQGQQVAQAVGSYVEELGGYLRRSKANRDENILRASFPAGTDGEAAFEYVQTIEGAEPFNLSINLHL